jgi:hypothetical protein
MWSLGVLAIIFLEPFSMVAGVPAPETPQMP